MRDVVASHNKMLYIFERIHFFLQRLNIYTGIPLTNELTELLGKIMAQLLCILALSTKAMKERRMSELIYLLFQDSPLTMAQKKYSRGLSEGRRLRMHLNGWIR